MKRCSGTLTGRSPRCERRLYKEAPPSSILPASFRSAARGEEGQHLEGGKFSAAMFFCEVEGHPEEGGLRLALEELAFFSTSLNVLGVYPADPFRRK